VNGMPRHWRVAGSYFEACNCDAVCPCRRVGKRLGGRSTYETCDFALSWRVLEGHADELELAGLSVALAGSYSDDEPGSPWRVVLYVEEDANPGQREALAAIFLGRAGGTTFENFGRLIGEVYAVRPARIALEHGPGREEIVVERHVVVGGTAPAAPAGSVSCGIPGHDHPGQELTAQLLRVHDGALRWEVSGRCGFATDFDYRFDG